MARVRSPNYPAISLPDAIKRVAQVFAKEHQHLAPKDVVVKGMGYGGVNGASLGALSAALKYGLLERQGEDYRVTDLAVSILHPQSPQEKADAIRAAAMGPTLFSELLEYFKGQLPSDDNLRAYLVRRGFGQSALGGFIQSFRETLDLVTAESGMYTEPKMNGQPPPAPPQAGHNPRSTTPMPTPTFYGSGAPIPPSAPPLPQQGAFRVSLTDDRLEVSGNLLDVETVERLIKVLEANKALLPAKREKPAAESEDQSSAERG